MRNIKYSILMVLLFVFFPSCKKDEIGTPTKKPEIISISINHGPFDTQVSISGLNFSSTTVENIVKFNGVLAKVISATASELTVLVPKRAGTGNISVEVKGAETKGPEFIYEFSYVVSTVTGKNNTAMFQYPTGVAVDKNNNIYVADLLSNQIKKIDTSGDVSILAGHPTAGFADGTGFAARFNYPWAIESDSLGTIYVADLYNHSIRKVTPEGRVTTIAGNRDAGYANGTGTEAYFAYPDGVALDGRGNVYVSDRDNYDIRIINNVNVVSSLYPDRYFTPFSKPQGLCFNRAGILYVCDIYRYDVTKVDVSDIWGWKNYGTFSSANDVVADAMGNIFVADGNKIRKMSPDGTITIIAGGDQSGFADGVGLSAKFDGVLSITIDAQGSLYIADARNGKIRKISFE